MSLPVNNEKIKGKKIIVFKPLLGQELIKMILKKLEAIWVSELEYLVGGSVDIVVGAKKIIPIKTELNIVED